MLSRTLAGIVGCYFLLAGCGGRSDPTELPPSTTGVVPGPGCDEPEPLVEDKAVTLRGTLGGSGGGGLGWCGGGGAGENVYVFSATKFRNVKVQALAGESDFDPTIHIQQDDCTGPSAQTEVCVTGSGSSQHTWPFLAEKGHDYFISISAPPGVSGDYAVELTWEPAKVSECDIHPEVIDLVPGGVFQWENDFGVGQGVVDGKCGGPGREDIFRVQVDQPGYLFAEAYSNVGMDPVLSFRVGCSGTNEKVCSAGDGDPYSAYLEYFIDDPDKNYYFSVDQFDVNGGGYTLNVYFD